MENTIWKSRKFWIAIVDVVISLTTYFTGKYFDPEAGKDIMIVIGSLQPVVLLLIGSITVQNVAGINATALTTGAKIAAVADVKVAEETNVPK